MLSDLAFAALIVLGIIAVFSLLFWFWIWWTIK